MKRFSFALLAALVLLPFQIRAATIMVEADNFAIGTDVRTAFPGITLSVQGEPSTQVIVVDGYSTFVGANVATTGTRMFGQSPATGSTIPDAEKTGMKAPMDYFGRISLPLWIMCRLI